MNTQFTPVRGYDAKIQTSGYNEGYVYFAIDTGRIYVDANGRSKVPVGASGVTILYANFPKDASPDEESLFTFEIKDLENSSIKPQKDSLILNSDGTFYRVKEVLDSQIICELISVSGGGVGPGAVTGSRTSLSIEPLANTSLINGQEVIVYFTASAEKDAEGNYTDNDVSINWVLEEAVGNDLYQQYLTGTISGVKNGEKTPLNLTDKLRQSTTSRLTLVAHSLNGNINNGNSYSRSVNFTTSELTLTLSTDFSNTKLFETNNAPIVYNVSGNMEKIVDIYLGQGAAAPQMIKTYSLSSGMALNETCSLEDYVNLEHGYYKVIIKVSQSINGNRGLSIEPLEFEIAVRDGLSAKPIIWLGEYKKEYYNYDDIKIPFLVYDPENTDSTFVHLYRNGIEMAGSPREEKGSNHEKFSVFEIIDAELNIQNYYSISCGDNERRIERQINFLVSQDPNRNMTLVKANNLKLLFDAKGRTNTESVTNRQNWKYNNIKAKFEDFNWYNNGWIQDQQGNTCLRISNGSKFILPVGKMTLAGSSVSEQSVAIEMQFKVRNIQDYTPLIHNVTRYKSDEKYYTAFKNQTEYSNYDSFLAYWLPLQTDESGKPIKTYDELEFDYVQKDINTSKAIASYIPADGSSFGMCVGSQDAFFSNGTNTVNVSFVENEMVYLTAVYTHSSIPSNRLLTIFINGVLTGVIQSTVDGSYSIGNDNFVFNSEFCDIDLYKMRIYNTNLTINEIITNYAVDTKDVIIFDQNNTKNGFVIDNSSIGELQLQYSGVEQYNINNPDNYTMPYIVFDTSANGDDAKKLPWSKKTDIKATVTFVNPALDRAYINGELEELAIKDGLCTSTDSIEIKEAAIENYYIHHCPSWTGDNVNMVVQGTSSEFYPRRNYKLKTKDKNDVINIFLNKGPFASKYLQYGKTPSTDEKENPCHMDFFYMDNYEVGTTKFTMKIDYMESSGSYNTGFANLVANAYSHHPMEDYVANGRFVNKEGTAPFELSQRYLDSVRTSVQGFPVMAFHKRGENDYVYIGRYNMNLDKGSDECYGFKPDKNMYAYNMDGELVRVRDLAECWEMQNNSRGYCSFKDPWNRPELSFDSEGMENGLTADKAPIVADSIEQRYHANADTLDLLWTLNKSTSASTKMDIWVDLGWAKKVDKIEADWVLNVDYALIDNKYYQYLKPELIQQYDFTDDNLLPGRQLFLRLLSNWERVNKWVWSTNIDNAISGGNYREIKLGKQKYVPNKFFIINDDNEYELDPYGVFKEEVSAYYEEVVSSDGTVNKVNAWVVNDENLVYKPKTFYANIEGTFTLQVSDVFDASTQYYRFEELSEAELDAKIAAGQALHTTKLPQAVRYDNVDYKYDTKEYRLAKFRNEIDQHFNIEYLATYFVMTEVFECYDSRGKNAMWASWGPLREGGDYIWYPIFYDIDTQLGINNTGIPSFEYNVDATDDGNYSTSDSLVWNNFYKCFKNTYILDKYKQLRGETVSTFPDVKSPILKSVDKIEKWYKCDPEECNSLVMRGIRPLIAINLDEYYKYLTIYNPAGVGVSPSSPLYGLTGRINDMGEYVVETTSYHYALQGDRSLSRRQFLTNRIEYIDSWLNVGNYSRGGYNRLWGRISARRPQEGGTFLNSDRWYEDPQNLAETSYYLDNTTEETKRYDFDSEYWATLTPIRNSYVTIQDDSAVYPAQKFSGLPLKVEFSALENGIRTGQDYNEQLCYIYGINQMKDLGDLYKMYWQEFKVEGEAGKLTKLLLGCDGLMTSKNADGSYSVVLDENGDTEYVDPVLNPDGTLKAYKWFNNKMNLPSMPSSANQTGMPLLKEANFSNITINTSSPVLDLTSCEKLEDFRATGSNFAQVKFASGVALNTLYLPATITTLELNEAKLLNNIVEEYHYPVRQNDGNYVMENKGLYIKGLTDGTSSTSAINTLIITEDSLGYDSYKLLEKYWNCIQNTSGKKITLTEVNWCPYTKLVEGDEYNPSEANLYYKDNGHYGLEPYEWINLNIFNADILNGEVYKKTNNNPYEIKSDEMIRLIKSNHDAKIEGIMYIMNDDEIDETVISNLNTKEKYPNLKLFYEGDINKAYSAKFVLPLELLDESTNTWTYEYVPVKNSSELSIQKIANEDYDSTKNIFASPFDLYNPEKLHYDFQGWSTSPDGSSGVITTEDEWNALIIDENSYSNIFYAIFTIKKYTITFKQGDNEEIVTEQEYGSNVQVPLNQPWADDSELDLTTTLAFIGYTGTEPSNGTHHIETDDMLVEDIAISKVIGNKTYYPVFNEMSVYDNIHEEYFIIDARGRISWNNDYTVRGKLTIPYQINNQKVTCINDRGFAGRDNLSQPTGLANVTHIFWSDKNGEVSDSFVDLGYGTYNLYYLRELVYFEMPPTVKYIPPYCFNGTQNLYTGAFSISDNVSYYIDDAFKNIREFGNNSFTNVKGIKDLIISDTTTTINNSAFSSMTNLATVQLGSNLDFNSCGNKIFDRSTAITKVTAPSKYNTPEWLEKFAFPDTVTIDWQ